MDIYFYLNYYWNWMAAQFSSYPPIIKFTIIMVALLVILYSVSLIRLLTIHRTKSKFERTRLKQVQELEQRLIKVLYDDRMYEERALNELFEDTKRLVKTSDEKYSFTQYMVELLETKQTEGHGVNISNYVTILDVYRTPNAPYNPEAFLA